MEGGGWRVEDGGWRVGVEGVGCRVKGGGYLFDDVDVVEGDQLPDGREGHVVDVPRHHHILREECRV